MYYIRPHIKIAMATEEPLKTVTGWLNGSVETITRENDKYQLSFHAPSLRWLLPALIPFLVLKRAQAQLVYEFVTRCRYQGKELTVEEFLAREAIMEKLHMLNMKPKTRRRLASQYLVGNQVS